MKINFCLLVVLINCANSFGQTKIQEFGKFTSEERKLKLCSFDTDAEAIILFDQAIIFHTFQNNYVTNRRIRFKILKESGLQRANIEIPYITNNDYEFVNQIEAIVETVNEFNVAELTKIDKSDFFRKEKDDHISVVSIAVPNVKVGSIIEYQYTSTIKGYNGFSEWYFQSDIPVLLSSVALHSSKTGLFTHQVFKKTELPITIVDDNNDTKMVFEMTSLPGLSSEPYMEAPRDCLQRVQFQLASFRDFLGKTYDIPTTWDEFSEQLLNQSYFGNAVNKNIDGSKEIINNAKAIKNDLEKLTYLYDFITTSFKWNNQYSKFGRKGLSKVWSAKTGNSGEINLTLINLLKEAGITVYPLLVSSRDHGRINPKQIFIDQFNKVVALVEAEGKRYILDGTAQFTPPTIIPYDLYNSYGLIVRRKNSGFIKLSDDQGRFEDTYKIETVVEGTEKISQAVNRKSVSFSRIVQEMRWKEGKETFIKQYQNSLYPDITIDNFLLSNETALTQPLEQKFTISFPTVKSGNYLTLPLVLFAGIGKNPFIADQRFSNINFGAQQRIAVQNIIHLPNNLIPESLPANQTISNEDSSILFTRTITSSGNTLVADIKLTIKRTIFTPDEYPATKDLFKKIVALLDEPLVLKIK